MGKRAHRHQIVGLSLHYLNQCWNIVNWTLRNKLQWNLKQNSYIFIEENAFENVVWKMAAILSRSPCVNQAHSASSPDLSQWRAPNGDNSPEGHSWVLAAGNYMENYGCQTNTMSQWKQFMAAKKATWEEEYLGGLGQDCSISNALAMERERD